MENDENLFGDEIISSYTDAEAINDGFLVDISKIGGSFNRVTNALFCLGYESSTGVACLMDLVAQARMIIGRASADDKDFASGMVELPSGSKTKVFVVANEVGGYTIMLPEDY